MSLTAMESPLPAVLRLSWTEHAAANGTMVLDLVYPLVCAASSWTQD